MFLAATVLPACDPPQQLVIREAGGLQQLGRIADAETLLIELAAKLEATGSIGQSCLATVLNNLGSINQDLGKYQAAEHLYSRALRIEEHRSSNDSDIPVVLDNLGSLYFETGRHRKAESVRVRALNLRIAKLGPNDPAVARIIQNLAAQKFAQGCMEEASRLYKQALAIWHASGLESTADGATALNGLGLLYAKSGDLQTGGSYVKSAIDIWVRSPGVSVSAARAEANLAVIRGAQGDTKAAEMLWRSAIERAEQSTGFHTAVTRDLLYNFMTFLRKQRRTSEAKEVQDRIEKIDKTVDKSPFRSAIIDISELESARSKK
jgi:tetratricopeptide (TPR) repeat protein